MKIARFEADLCERCVGFMTYGTVGDWSKPDQSPWQKEQDRRHADTMLSHLGVPAIGFEGDAESTFSWPGCEGCGAQSLNVYAGMIFYYVYPRAN